MVLCWKRDTKPLVIRANILVECQKISENHGFGHGSNATLLEIIMEVENCPLGPWMTMFLYQQVVVHFHDCFRECA